ncbi:DUF871 family protein [Staphylococcus taiwanensis]|nr:DUF871 family protein [Staphylococcus taiwanensis]
MLGFSVYLGQPLNKPYILNMVELGYDYIFTSLQIPEENDDNKLIYLGELCQLLQDASVTYIIDINPSLLNQRFYSFFKQFPNENFIIRIDNHLNMSLLNDLYQQQLKCCLNASTITSETLDLLYKQDNLPEIYYCHNYYPRPDTGLSLSFVEQKNQLILSYDDKAIIMGFVPGTTLRGPMYKGLPTIEKHRHMSLLEAVHSLLNASFHHIIISDVAISESEAIALNQMVYHRHFTLKLSYYDKQYESEIFTTYVSRLDAPEHIIRSRDSRTSNHYVHYQQNQRPIRYRGDVTIDNEMNLRYEGELQIIKTHLSHHPAINHVATISEQDHYLIDLIQPGDSFEFISEKEDNNDYESFNN